MTRDVATDTSFHEASNGEKTRMSEPEHYGKTASQWVDDLADEDRRGPAVDVLDEIGPAAVPALAAGLSHAEGIVQCLAASILMDMGAPALAAVPALETALKDPDETVGMRAAQALVRLRPGHGPAINVLAKSLKAELGWVRIDAAKILESCGPDASAAILALEEAREDPSPVLRKLVEKALSRIRRR